MRRLVMVVGAACLLTACGKPEKSQDEKIAEAMAKAEADYWAKQAAEPKPEPVNLSAKDKARVCRAAIASVMGRDPAIIKVVSNANDIIRVRYTRDDGTVWQQQCNVLPDKVIWAAVDVNGPGTGPGRWRFEDEILYRLDGSRIWIRESMDGEVVDEETYDVP